MYFKEIMCTCVSVYRYVHMSAGACKGQKKASNFLQLELWVIVPDMGPGNWTQVLCKSSMYS